MLLKDKVCIVAGAASLRSIGYATAELFVEHGAKVVVTDVSMNEDVLATIKKQIETRLNTSSLCTVFNVTLVTKQNVMS